ncbi:helix-turn-helix domain-containing protein [Neobacillus sp. NRS-1170]|uniref:helix-turn-helix domain-containing protein n=1 Tax=Neobacillus sp. NRS-1170 TaxID=3233898 RepID=UPI003D29BADE
MELYFKFKLKELLERKGLQQKELAQMTGLREATISELVNDTRGAYNKNHLLTIMEALNLTELSDLLEVRKYNESRKSTGEFYEDSSY